MMNKTRLLVVDDDPDLRSIVHEALGTRYEISTLESADDLDEAVSLFAPDLVIMDVVMPGLDGISACRRLRSSKAGRGVPVLFLTAVPEEKNVWKGLGAGANGWLAKPFNAKRLREKVREILADYSAA
ncbi:MAG: response regulator transcription factor [Elusimicrobiota bacterium]